MAIAGEAQANAQAWIGYLWAGLMVVWIAALFRTRRTVRRQSASSRLWQMGILALGGWLLWVRQTGFPWMDARAVPETASVALTGLALALAGVGFAIWARLVLGANWSGTVTLKQGHTLVRRGPYRIVRHPIYTGILIALAGTVLAQGWVHSFVALPICAFGLWLKSLTEEQFMVEQFGDEYLRYRQDVPALTPFIGGKRAA